MRVYWSDAKSLLIVIRLVFFFTRRRQAELGESLRIACASGTSQGILTELNRW
jgi:hypothetical protein